MIPAFPIGFARGFVGWRSVLENWDAPQKLSISPPKISIRSRRCCGFWWRIIVTLEAVNRLALSPRLGRALPNGTSQDL